MPNFSWQEAELEKWPKNELAKLEIAARGRVDPFEPEAQIRFGLPTEKGGRRLFPMRRLTSMGLAAVPAAAIAHFKRAVM